ncbi:MAG: hypothetical protein F6K42_27255, partial [Leptolyngbya sp. SIO1D8]|nr:hypothetical protein [Leptolyngbya sp. SIO1D8]
RPSPFSYQIAVAHALIHTNRVSENWPRPSLPSQIPLNQQLEHYFERTNAAQPPLPARAYLHPLTEFSYLFHQRWLQPLLDFSLPPEQVYTRVPAWQLLQTPEVILQELGVKSLQNQAVIIAAGGYDTAGLDEASGDIADPPPAFAYWQEKTEGISRKLTLGESHGYMVHHLLTPWLVVPIPALGLILLAVIGGKALRLRLDSVPQIGRLQWMGGMIGGTLGYGLLSLQVYVSGAVMLPWLLPSLTVWCFVWPILWEKQS